MQYVKQSTETYVIIGPFVDVSDGFTPETGVTLAAADEAEILKHSTTSVTDISGATMAAVASCDGYYALTLTTSHTDTCGRLTVVIQDDSVCLPVRADFMVVNANVYDSLFAAATTDYLDVNTFSITANAITATAINADAITSAKIADDALSAEHFATDSISADALKADAVTEIVTGILAGVVEGTTTVVQALRAVLSLFAGEITGLSGGAGSATIRDFSDTKTRAVATIDADGNRTAVASIDLT